uniref:Uncharacterized protein n=1 Tax=viral metagenome TaxID=1070528 RepID=A0A6C0JAX2_9ZZZZ
MCNKLIQTKINQKINMFKNNRKLYLDETQHLNIKTGAFASINNNYILTPYVYTTPDIILKVMYMFSDGHENSFIHGVSMESVIRFLDEKYGKSQT